MSTKEILLTPYPKSPPSGLAYIGMSHIFHDLYDFFFPVQNLIQN
jgi:hypothetical protein